MNDHWSKIDDLEIYFSGLQFCGSHSHMCVKRLKLRKQYVSTFAGRLREVMWNFYRIMTQWISFPCSLFLDKPALLLMVPLHEKSDNRSQPGQKLSKKEKWLRNLIKSNLVDSDAWWRAHYEAWSFSNDTTVSRTRRKTWLGWQALSDTANLLITWKLEGAHAKKGD